MTKLNHIHVTTSMHSSYKPWGNSDKQGVTVNCERERWTLHIDTTEGPDNLELARIHLRCANKSWTGTIQDFMAIANYAENALCKLSYINETEFNQMAEWPEVNELNQLLSHFSLK